MNEVNKRTRKEKKNEIKETKYETSVERREEVKKRWNGLMRQEFVDSDSRERGVVARERRGKKKTLCKCRRAKKRKRERERVRERERERERGCYVEDGRSR